MGALAKILHLPDQIEEKMEAFRRADEDLQQALRAHGLSADDARIAREYLLTRRDPKR